jgi:hypothetical protein
MSEMLESYQDVKLLMNKVEASRKVQGMISDSEDELCRVRDSSEEFSVQRQPSTIFNMSPQQLNTANVS